MIMMPMIMFTSGVLSFLLQKKHCLPLLISIEMMMLSCLAVVSFNYTDMNKTQSAIFIISFMVAESAAAISILVNFSKSKGNDILMF